MEKVITAQDIKVKDDMFICGDYVLSPHKNAFNELISYWISKKLCTISVYAFTLETADDVKPENIAKNFSGYITLFDETLERMSND